MFTLPREIIRPVQMKECPGYVLLGLLPGSHLYADQPHHFTLKYFTGRTISPVGRPALFARLPPELFINKA